MEKNARHSFQRSKFSESIDMQKNKFGHTKLGSEDDGNILPEEKMTNKIDANGDVSAETSVDLDSVLNNMQKIMGQDRLGRQMAAHNLEVDEEVKPVEKVSTAINLPVLRQKFSMTTGEEDNEDFEESSKSYDEEEGDYPEQSFSINRKYSNSSDTMQVDDVIDRFDALRTAVKERKILKATSVCTNEQCEAEIPKNTRYCGQCGTPQFHVLGRHCVNCGIKFNGSEKFCSECGYTR